GHCTCTVTASIVDDKDLGIPVSLGKDRLESRTEKRRSLERRDDDRHTHRDHGMRPAGKAGLLASASIAASAGGRRTRIVLDAAVIAWPAESPHVAPTTPWLAPRAATPPNATAQPAPSLRRTARPRR